MGRGGPSLGAALWASSGAWVGPREGASSDPRWAVFRHRRVPLGERLGEVMAPEEAVAHHLHDIHMNAYTYMHVGAGRSGSSPLREEGI